VRDQAQPAYLDSSVLLRIMLNEPGIKLDLTSYSKIFSSRLLRTECFRVINRLFLEKRIDEAMCASVQQRLRFSLQGIALVDLNDNLLQQAEGTFPLPIGTLDALHLATALTLRNNKKFSSLVLLTHDDQLGRCGQTMGLTVLGL